MKKVERVVISSVLVTSMLFSITSCDKAGKMCTEVGDDFMGALLERDAEDLAELCSDEDEALAVFEPYCIDHDAVEAVLSRASFEAGKPSCKTKDKKGEIEYTITLPDYESCLDEDPEDVDEFEDLLDETKDTIEMTVTLEFKLKKEDWLIDNAEDIADEIYGELFDVDWGFESIYTSKVDYGHFYGSSNDVYDDPYCLDYDLYFTETVNIDVTFEVVFNGNVIYNETRSASYYVYCYCYPEDTSLGDDEFPAGDYTYNVYDEDGALIISATCTVEN